MVIAPVTTGTSASVGKYSFQIVDRSSWRSGGMLAVCHFEGDWVGRQVVRIMKLLSKNGTPVSKWMGPIGIVNACDLMSTVRVLS
jgi:hypothetical protein